MGGNSKRLALSAADAATGSLTLWRIAIRGWFSLPVIRALAASPRAPQLLLWSTLVKRWDVRAAAGANPRCPRPLLRVLSSSSCRAIRAAVASNAAASRMLLRYLIDTESPSVRLYVTQNPSLTPALADRLVGDQDPYVRGAAAAHPAVSAAALQKLADGMSQPAWILRAIATNPMCPADLSDQLLTWIALGGSDHQDPLFDPINCTGHPGDTRIPVALWYDEQGRHGAASRHALWRVRAGLLRAVGRIGPLTAMELARDPRSEVRLAIASAQQLGANLARKLRADPDAQVARRAADRPVASNRAPSRFRANRFAISLSFAALMMGVLALRSQLSGQSPPTPSTSSPPGTAASALAPLATNTHALPGGGVISCSTLPTLGSTLVSVIGGSMQLTLHVSNSATTGQGDPLSAQTVPAGGTDYIWLPSSSTPITVTVTPKTMPSMRLTLTGCPT